MYKFRRYKPCDKHDGMDIIMEKNIKCFKNKKGDVYIKIIDPQKTFYENLDYDGFCTTIYQDDNNILSISISVISI